MGSSSAPARLLTAREAADRLAVSLRTLRTIIGQGELPVVRVGIRGLRIHPEDLHRFIEERRGVLCGWRGERRA
ncbi:MAG: helix-turn-helix domain-containing protein [Planctomycetes bacterium]|nr:helix-turn-helix domain-containing protein [Planctomycetota bacterium]